MVSGGGEALSLVNGSPKDAIRRTRRSPCAVGDFVAGPDPEVGRWVRADFEPILKYILRVLGARNGFLIW